MIRHNSTPALLELIQFSALVTLVKVKILVKPVQSVISVVIQLKFHRLVCLVLIRPILVPPHVTRVALDNTHFSLKKSVMTLQLVINFQVQRKSQRFVNQVLMHQPVTRHAQVILITIILQRGQAN